MRSELPQRSRMVRGLATGGVFLILAVVLSTTVDDLGLTWDEPGYRYAQLRMEEWFDALWQCRSGADLQRLFSRETLHEQWIAGRWGKDFHPPLAAMLGSMTNAVFGPVMGDEMSARRMCSALELAAAAAMLFHVIGSRYGTSSGLVAAASLCLMPRVFGHGNLAATDMPMLLAWAATVMAFWKARTGSRGWAAVFAILLGFSFLVKQSTMLVLAPVVVWAIAQERYRWPGWRRASRALALVTLMAAPLAIVGVRVYQIESWMWESTQQIHQESGVPRFQHGDRWSYLVEEYLRHPERHPQLQPGVPAWLLFVPLAVWAGRWVWLRRPGRKAESREQGSGIFRPEPSALRPPHSSGGPCPFFEVLVATLAIVPAMVLIMHPGWWPDPLVRLAHYLLLGIHRKETLPNIEIFYLGQKYLYTLPWHNAGVLVAVTVPVGIIALAVFGAMATGLRVRRDAFPLFLLLNGLTLPVARTFPTPGHDGVRLILPAFFFMAGLAGVGFAWLGMKIVQRLSGVGGASMNHRRMLPVVVHGILAAGAIGPAGYGLLRVHPYDLSYYNIAVGNLSGAVQAGFEASYWYDAVHPGVVRQLNEKLPQGALITIDQLVAVFDQLQLLGKLRGDIRLEESPQRKEPRFLVLLTHSSKSRPTYRLIYAMRPAWIAAEHRGVRLVSVYDEAVMCRAQALTLLLAIRESGGIAEDGAGGPLPLSVVSPVVLRLAQQQPEAIIQAATVIAGGTGGRFDETSAVAQDHPAVRQVLDEVLGSLDRLSLARLLLAELQRKCPEAIIEAGNILARRPQDVARIVSYPGYLPPQALDTYLDSPPSIDR